MFNASNCHSLEVVGRGGETQLQVGELLIPPLQIPQNTQTMDIF